jgi:leucyl aminopeptidase
MQFDVWSKGLATLEADCLVVGVFEEGELTEEAQPLDAATGGRLGKLVTRGDFSGRSGETLLIPDVVGLKASRLLLTGLGTRKNFGRKAFRKALSSAVTALNRTRIESVAFAVTRPSFSDVDDYYFGRIIAEVVGTTLYKVNDLKSARKGKPPALQTVIAGPVRGAGATAAKRGLAHGMAVAAAAKVQRDLANLPANVCTPAYLADQAKALAKSHASVKVTVLDEAAIRKEKMGCLLAVAQGSAVPPRFIVIEYKGPKAPKAPIVLVGKGITFDTGGISLKDPGAMDEMKFDMSGSAAVIAALTLAATLRLPLHVVGLIAAAENMPGSRAIKPGDIVTSAPAYGRNPQYGWKGASCCVTLHYARRLSSRASTSPRSPACVWPGAHHAGCMANTMAWRASSLPRHPATSAWQLPSPKSMRPAQEHRGLRQHRRSRRRAITAAAFLGKFTQGLKWAHLDIAGVAYLGGTNKGSTGRPTALLADFLIHRAGR